MIISNLSLVCLELLVLHLRFSSFVDLMLLNQKLSGSLTSNRILQISDSVLIGDHVLTNKESSLAKLQLQEQEISLDLVRSSISVIRLREILTAITPLLYTNTVKLVIMVILVRLHHPKIMVQLVLPILLSKIMVTSSLQIGSIHSDSLLSVVLQSPKKSMFMVTMVMIMIQELLVHCLHSRVLLSPSLAILPRTLFFTHSVLDILPFHSARVTMMVLVRSLTLATELKEQHTATILLPLLMMLQQKEIMDRLQMLLEQPLIMVQ